MYRTWRKGDPLMDTNHGDSKVTELYKRRRSSSEQQLSEQVMASMPRKRAYAVCDEGEHLRTALEFMGKVPFRAFPVAEIDISKKCACGEDAVYYFSEYEHRRVAWRAAL